MTVKLDPLFQGFFEEAEFVLQRLQVGEFDFDDALGFACVGNGVQLHVFKLIHQRGVRLGRDTVESRFVAVEDRHREAFASGDSAHRVLLQFRNACRGLSEDLVCHDRISVLLKALIIVLCRFAINFRETGKSRAFRRIK